MLASKILGVLIGLGAAALWFYVDGLVYSFLILSRVAENWRMPAQIGAPILFFGVLIVLPTYYAFTRLPKPTAKTAILIAACAFVVLAVWPYAFGDTATSGLITLGANLVFVIGGAFLAWRGIRN